MELAKDLMAEFVFCEIDRRGGRRRKLGCIQELQLLEALCDFFKPSYTSGNSDTTRNLVFMALFPPSVAERSRLLVKLVSMAISTKNVPVLAATGIWMQEDKEENRRGSKEDREENRRGSKEDREENRRGSKEDREENRRGSKEDREENRRGSKEDREENRRGSKEDREENRRGSKEDREENRRGSKEDREENRRGSKEDREENRRGSKEDREENRRGSKEDREENRRGSKEDREENRRGSKEDREENRRGSKEDREENRRGSKEDREENRRGSKEDREENRRGSKEDREENRRGSKEDREENRRGSKEDREENRRGSKEDREENRRGSKEDREENRRGSKEDREENRRGSKEDREENRRGSKEDREENRRGSKEDREENRRGSKEDREENRRGSKEDREENRRGSKEDREENRRGSKEDREENRRGSKEDREENRRGSKEDREENRRGSKENREENRRGSKEDREEKSGISLSYEFITHLSLAEGLVKDYFVLVPKAVSGLQDLPQLAPHFTANFLTSVAEMYSSGDKRQVLTPPPNTLLEVVTQWVSDNPPLCLAALLNKTATAVTTPFVGLFKWCILSPLYYCGRTSSTEHSTLYSRLHLALLESLVRCGKPLAANGKTVISVQHVVSIVDPLIRWYKEVDKLPDGSKAVELALDRLAQAVQIGLFTGCIAGDKEELLKMLDMLPEHRVLKLVIKKQRELLTQNMDILEDDVIIVSDTSQTRMVIMSPDLPRLSKYYLKQHYSLHSKPLTINITFISKVVILFMRNTLSNNFATRSKQICSEEEYLCEVRENTFVSRKQGVFIAAGGETNSWKPYVSCLVYK
ncbi:unnamed protein product [Timema podura]|uniref:Uncharacterized protein n=1 Tax=Timema podura TaxID=61482 RepID=A0ABN7NGK8_TIMPD|nr:unnamed protein product [Timema podura]